MESNNWEKVKLLYDPEAEPSGSLLSESPENVPEKKTEIRTYQGFITSNENEFRYCGSLGSGQFASVTWVKKGDQYYALKVFSSKGYSKQSEGYTSMVKFAEREIAIARRLFSSPYVNLFSQHVCCLKELVKSTKSVGGFALALELGQRDLEKEIIVRAHDRKPFTDQFIHQTACHFLKVLEAWHNTERFAHGDIRLDNVFVYDDGLRLGDYTTGLWEDEGEDVVLRLFGRKSFQGQKEKDMWRLGLLLYNMSALTTTHHRYDYIIKDDIKKRLDVIADNADHPNSTSLIAIEGSLNTPYVCNPRFYPLFLRMINKEWDATTALKMWQAVDVSVDKSQVVTFCSPLSKQFRDTCDSCVIL